MTLQQDPGQTGTREVFFDYTCPFTHRAWRWLQALPEVPATWRPSSPLLFAAESGVDAAESDVPRHFLDAEVEHASGAKLGMFGTPSLRYSGGEAR